jgi:hypothetical protein
VSRGGVFVLGEKRLKRLAAALPIRLEVAVRIAEGVGETAPADIAGEGLLLGGGGAAVLALDGLEGFDGRDVVAELDALRALSKLGLVSDAVVDRREVWSLLGRYICGGSLSTGGFL